MKRLVGLVLLLGCSEPMAPVMVPDAAHVIPDPELQFIGSCQGAALWWLGLDDDTLGPIPLNGTSGIFLFTATDSLSFPPAQGPSWFRWRQLNPADGHVITGGMVRTGRQGAARIEATCRV